VWALSLYSLIEARASWLFEISIEGYIGLALLLSLLGTLLLLPTLKRAIDNSDSFYARAFVDFLEQPQIGRILAFVILFRAGESLLLKMRYPFFSDLGMSLPEYGLASGTVGLVLSFSATLLGGALISSQSLRRWIWPFVLMQNTLNLVFAGVGYYAASLPIGQEIGLTVLTLALGLESFGSGLGTAVFMVYLMRCCRPDFKAAHMAIVTAMMSISFTLAGVCSGFLAEWLGYGSYFVLSFCVAVPGMALIPFIPHLDTPKGSNKT
jgi:PAT family beta-lactamase induction signal transducer AmpG